MKNHISVRMIILLVVLLMSYPAMGFCADKKDATKTSHQGKGLWQEEEKSLGLNPDQQAKMKALREGFRAKQQALREQIKAKYEALRLELDSNTPDRAKAESILKEINSLQAQMGGNRIDEIFQVRGILTPEQFQKLREFPDKNKAKREEKMKNGKAKGHFHPEGFPEHGPEGE